MTLIQTIIALIITVCLLGVTYWKEKNYQPGNPSLVPVVYWQILLVIAAIVFIAHIFTLTTGLVWDPPFRR